MSSTSGQLQVPGLRAGNVYIGVQVSSAVLFSSSETFQNDQGRLRDIWV